MSWQSVIPEVPVKRRAEVVSVNDSVGLTSQKTAGAAYFRSVSCPFFHREILFLQLQNKHLEILSITIIKLKDVDQ